MNDFDFDVMQKKRIAAGARHKVNGSKSKFVGLPSDHMTPAQLKAKSGPCMTYDLNSRLDYEVFKEMPDDLKVEYLRGLNSRFNVGMANISRDLFHKSKATLWAYLKNSGIRCSLHGKHLSDAESAAWEAWLNAEEEPHTDRLVEEDVMAPVLEEPVSCEPADGYELMKPGFMMIPREEGLQVSDLTATFTGNFEPEKFMRWMAMLPMPEGKVKIRVEVTKE